MTVHLSMRSGDVSISRTLTGDPGQLEAQVVALLARLLAMAQTAQEMSA